MCTSLWIFEQQCYEGSSYVLTSVINFVETFDNCLLYTALAKKKLTISISLQEFEFKFRLQNGNQYDCSKHSNTSAIKYLQGVNRFVIFLRALFHKYKVI